MTAAPAPVVSVLVVARNAASTIGEQLDALAGQAFGAPWEIVVVDDGSTDATASIVDARAAVMPWLHRVAGPGRGVAAARNAALAAARAPYLAMVDADDVVAPGWLAAMVAALDDAPLVAGALEIDRLNPEWVRGTRGRALTLGPGSFAGIVPFAHSCNLGVRRDLVDRIGPFDETIEAGEDVEFSYRAWRDGVEPGYAAAAVVHYRYRTTLGALWRQGRSYGRVRAILGRRFTAQGLALPPATSGRARLGLLKRLPQCVTRTGRANWVFAAAGVVGASGA
jgi:glycosyltransferase involved in cell wall biosynthesis